jgi:hypothetical protein
MYMKHWRSDIVMKDGGARGNVGPVAIPSTARPTLAVLYCDRILASPMTGRRLTSTLARPMLSSFDPILYFISAALTNQPSVSSANFQETKWNQTLPFDWLYLAC